MPEATILTICHGYLPGYKHGGSIRSVANLVERLGKEFHFRVVAADRDQGDLEPYTGIRPGFWQAVGKADVYYEPPGQRSARSLRRLIRTTPYDVLYLNSCFSPGFAIRPLLLRRLRLVPSRPTIIAPRGELTAGALSIKPWKKRMYLMLAKVLGLYRDVLWQASSESEEAEIRSTFGGAVSVVVAPDLVSPAEEANLRDPRRRKVSGSLKVVFLSRIAPKKNLLGALRLLSGVRGQIEFGIYGPKEDARYWSECERVMRELPENVRATYHGPAAHEDVRSILMEHDLFLFPTLGENYGHVIVEALEAGCPVIVSDQTPWRGLESAGVGWDLPLDEPERIRVVLEQCLDMDGETHAALARRARAYAAHVATDEKIVERNRQLIRNAMNRAGYRLARDGRCSPSDVPVVR